MGRLPEFRWLKADGRSMEATSWERWLRHVVKTRKAFAKFIDYDPMSNETASCGVLSSAASSAGLLSMTEYVCEKKHQTDYRKKGHGRADLWVADPSRDISWAFEAKQLRCVRGTRIPTIEAAMRRACHDASRLTDLEADRFYGLLIATLPPDEDCEDFEAVCERLDDFAEETTFACKFGGLSPAWAFFRHAARDRG